MAEVTGLTGFDDVTINLVTYAVNSIDAESQNVRVIERTDSNGDASDYEIRTGSTHIQGTMELQRATSSTAFPTRGQSFTYDFDDSGTASTLEVTSVKANRSKDAMMTFTIGFLVAAYQA